MKRLKFLLALLGLASVLCLPTLAAADVNNFTVLSFAADETLTRNDPQGQLHVTERINVNFTDQNHGLLRALPDSYKGHSLQLHVVGVQSSDTNAPVDHTTYTSNGNTVLKIGSPSQTVTGLQEYTIEYTLNNVISFYKDHAELYWNVNGTQWQQPFGQVAVTLHLPKDLEQSRSPVCYTGSRGSTNQDCTITSKDGTIKATTTSQLLPGQNLTYVAGFQTGYFTAFTWRDTIAEHLVAIAEFLLPVIILGGGTFAYWWTRGRDPKGRGTIIPQYNAPDGLKPAEVGTIADFKLDNRDITATIIDLAIRKYIKILEVKEKRTLQKDKTIYKLELLTTDFSQLDPQEQKLIDALFDNNQVGAQVNISESKTKLSKTAETYRKDMSAKLTTAGYFRGNPLTANRLIAIPAVAIIFGLFYVGSALGWPLAVGLLVGGGVMLLFSRAMAARTAKGVEAQEHILGLKLYLDVAEKDRINALQSPDAKYAAPSAEPVKTVELFEKLLPYAIVLGVEKNWAGKFQDIYVSPPGWYGGDWTTFNTIYLVTALNDGVGSAVNSTFSAPTSSGSSGFGGGGFSGGGGGGGGGGGW